MERWRDPCAQYACSPAPREVESYLTSLHEFDDHQHNRHLTNAMFDYMCAAALRYELKKGVYIRLPGPPFWGLHNILIVVIDYRTGFEFGHGPRERSDAYWRRCKAAFCGVGFFFCGIGPIYVDVLSAEYYHDAWASCIALTAALKQLQKLFPRAFAQLREIAIWCDQGSHFMNYAFAGFVLHSIFQVFPQFVKSWLAFFEKHHGKTLLDRHFGWLTLLIAESTKIKTMKTVQNALFTLNEFGRDYAQEGDKKRFKKSQFTAIEANFGKGRVVPNGFWEADVKGIKSTLCLTATRAGAGTVLRDLGQPTTEAGTGLVITPKIHKLEADPALAKFAANAKPTAMAPPAQVSLSLSLSFFLAFFLVLSVSLPSFLPLSLPPSLSLSRRLISSSCASSDFTAPRCERARRRPSCRRGATFRCRSHSRASVHTASLWLTVSQFPPLSGRDR